MASESSSVTGGRSLEVIETAKSRLSEHVTKIDMVCQSMGMELNHSLVQQTLKLILGSTIHHINLQYLITQSAIILLTYLHCELVHPVPHPDKVCVRPPDLVPRSSLMHQYITQMSTHPFKSRSSLRLMIWTNASLSVHSYAID